MREPLGVVPPIDQAEDSSNRFYPIDYSALNAKQREVFNFQKVSAILADYGYSTHRLTADWNGADFLAAHLTAPIVLRVQLKTRPAFAQKYWHKNLWICFQYGSGMYLYQHDEALDRIQALGVWDILGSETWRRHKVYAPRSIPAKVERVLAQYYYRPRA